MEKAMFGNILSLWSVTEQDNKIPIKFVTP